MECDVTRSVDVERAVKGTVERFGRLNVLVNNAGALHVSTVEGISEEEWDRVMTVNVKGPFLMSRAVLPEFRKAGGGAIVNVGSILGLIAMKDRAAYCSSTGVNEGKRCARQGSRVFRWAGSGVRQTSRRWQCSWRRKSRPGSLAQRFRWMGDFRRTEGSVKRDDQENVQGRKAGHRTRAAEKERKQLDGTSRL